MIDYELSRNYSATWKAMEALVESGKAKSIGTACVLIIANSGADANSIAGLSHFNILKTRKLLKTARIIPAVNQVELHP